MAEYPINKGVGRQVEFKGLRAQFLFLFEGERLRGYCFCIAEREGYSPVLPWFSCKNGRERT